MAEAIVKKKFLGKKRGKGKFRSVDDLGWRRGERMTQSQRSSSEKKGLIVVVLGLRRVPTGVS